jgi:hypothetical protein
MMELHSHSGQTIENFAEKLFIVNRVVGAVGIFNDTRIPVEVWDSVDSLVEKYYSIRNRRIQC